MINTQVEVTVVFQKIEEAINAKYPDGSRRYKYIILTGSSRSSKTRSIIQVTHKYANQHKNKRISVWRDTLKDCKDTVGNDISRIYPELPLAEYTTLNKADQIYTFQSGSVFEIKGTDEPKKVHGYNGHVVWLNEPYLISKDTFDQLDMRAEDFIIIDWNPKQAHWIDDLMKDKRAIVIHSTFKDNPFCPPEQKLKILSYQPVEMCQAVIDKVLEIGEAKAYNLSENHKKLSERQLKELERCIENERKNSASLYNWMVYGLGLHAEKPNRIFFWKEITDQQYLAIDSKKYVAVDWGTVDPWGILEAKYYDGGLYLHELNYASENAIRELMTFTEREAVSRSEEGIVRWMFETKLKIEKNVNIICDNNRPLKILELFNCGYDYATSAPKPPGSIIDGIDLLNDINVYYTESSTNLKYEQENYERDVDRYGKVLDEPIDKDNHCFVGETMIETGVGKKRIDQINRGDLVLTSKGFKRVLKAWDNGEKQTFKYSMHFGMFSLDLICTPNHLIKTDQGWIQISKLKSGMMVSLIRHLTGENITSMRAKDILEKIDSACIGTYGNTSMVSEERGFMCIIKTTILGIIDRVTLRKKNQTNIFQNTSKKDSERILNGQKNSIQKESNQPSSGIIASRELNGIVIRAPKHGLGASTKQSNASTVEMIIKPDTQENQNIVITTVKLLRLESGEEKINKVYDLTVEETHEYFANGLLVHNCMDPARYIALWLSMMGIIKRDKQ